jgi:hypothetical protein
MNQWIKIIGARFNNAPTIGLSKFLIRPFGDIFQIADSFLFMRFIEHFRQAAVILIEANNGLIYQHNLGVFFGQLIF